MRKVLLAITVTLLVQSPSWGYRPEGHQQIGAIADTLIKYTAAQKQVHRILGKLSLKDVAVWADCAKGTKPDSQGKFSYKSDLEQFPECKPFESPDDKKRFERFVQRNWEQCGTANGVQHCHDQYHYTDVSTFHSDYRLGYAGTSMHDVVHAINAAVDYLKHRNVPSPFDFKDEKEALMLLAHYVGDLHQPLHVVAVYLNSEGNVIDPDAGSYDNRSATDGGNKIYDRNAPKAPRFHYEWDDIPDTLWIGGSRAQALLTQAREVALAPGEPDGWPVAWATEMVRAGPDVFSGLSFAPEKVQSSDGHVSVNSWSVTGVDAAYQNHATDLKAEKIAKAGARLAQLLNAIWPTTRPATSAVGYLTKDQLPHIGDLVASAPTSGSWQDAADMAAVKATRPLLKTYRGKQAADDDVFDPAAIVARFNDALGMRFTTEDMPTLMKVIERVEQDASATVKPIKRDPPTGKERPFVRIKGLATCLNPVDLSNHREEDLYTYGLAHTGSYPSTHALMGVATALVLEQLVPERSEALLARGYTFGESRLVCGFHYPSDIDAGRLAGFALIESLRKQPEFISDMQRASQELARQPTTSTNAGL